MTRRTRRSLVILPVLAGLLSACGGDDPTFPPEFDASLHVDLASMTKTSSGLYYQDLVVGTGSGVTAGQTVTVAYTGWLPNGTKFDSGTLPPFPAGVGRVVPGFDEGLLGMRVGGKRKLVIPPALGYGGRGVGAIPPNSTLVFEVELRNIS